MNWRSIVAIVVSIYCFYFWWTSSFAYRYRIAVDVETDSGVKSGFGIIESRWQYYPRWIPMEQHWHLTAVGEIPIVDLGERGLVLATFGVNTPHNKCLPISRDLSNAAAYALRRTEPGRSPAIYSIDKFEMLEAFRTYRDRYQLAPFELPQFVWLPDRNEWHDAHIVCPEKFSSDIHPTVRLKGVFVEMTNDQVDGSIHLKLPWLKSLQADDPVLPNGIPSRKFKLKRSNILGE